MQNEANQGQVLPFARSAEYLRRLAVKQREARRPLQALELLRLSLSKSPDDPETLRELAATYADMHCPELSNRALFSLFSAESVAPECLYAAGCNFFTMQMFDCARDCIVLALQKKPDAPFVAQAIDIIDEIDEELHGASVPESRINRRIGRALDALERGNALLATRLMRRVLSLERLNGSAHALLSFALLASDDAEGALEAARYALRCSKEDIRVLSAMAAALHSVGSKSAAAKFLARAVDKIAVDDDVQLICHTACQMEAHACVRSVLLPLEAETPYADELLHLTAIACYNLGEKDEAIRRWKLLRRIDPMDAVAEYMLRLAEEGALPPTLRYERRLPLAETLRRLSTLRGWVQEGAEAFRARWTEGDALERLLRWGLSSDEPGVPQAMMGILATLGDARARAALRDVLSDSGASGATKHGALAALFLAGSKGPHHALMDGRLTLVHVSKADQQQKDQHLEAMARFVLKRVSPASGDEETRVRTLCALAVRQPGILASSLRARAVEFVFRRERGESVTFDAKRDLRRKLERFARRLVKEGTT